MTLQESQMSLFEDSEVWTLSVEDFRARLSALRELDEVLKIHEELCSLKSVGSHLFSDLNIYSLKTSEDSSITTGGLHSKPSSEPWTDWGMMWNGKFVTAKISESHKTGNVCSLSDILEENVPETFFLSSEKMQNLMINSQKIEIIGNTKNPNGTGQGTGSVVYNSNGLVGTLLARDYKEPKQIAIPKIRVKEATKQGYAEAEIGDSINLSHPNSKTRRGRVGKQIANTLLTGESQGVVEPDFRIRKLTPRECWRLQGFPDWAFDKAKEVNSNSQLYKQAGNSVTVNVIAAIAKELK